jgi:glycogen phosphorylase
MTQPIDAFISKTHVAYFCMEMALRTEIHTYSGGLGILAGDTARSCADLGIPVVFVSLMSRKGYLRQKISAKGRQIEQSDPWDPAAWATPLDCMVAIELEGRRVWIRPWLYRLTSPHQNAIPVILLDTACEENDERDRDITDVLYGGDETYRLRQEAVLGIGGVRILQALGFSIRTYHLNEGHPALLTIELLRRHERPSRPVESCEPRHDSDPVVRSCVFTTHTPVAAAVDKFDYRLVEQVLGGFFDPDELKHYAGAEFCNMTQLALNLSGYVNGVAERHARTTETLFPGHRVRAIANGIHTATWAHPAFRRLYDTHFPHWLLEPEALMRADRLDDSETWSAHNEAKNDLISYVRDTTGVGFDPGSAVLGFARRMTGYKRPELLFHDLQRLQAINDQHPIQVAMAGKAHAKDTDGKVLIELIHEHMHALDGKIRIAYLPNYDLEAASKLVSGCDLWLNTPLPPLEASGTSGMKAAVNGVLNFSVLDGWWVEGCIEGVTGWAIGTDEPSANSNHADDLYDKLERTILPLFYGNRTRWIWMMKQAISKLAPVFNSQHMMRRYASEAYLR